MKITAIEIKPGMIIEHKNDYWNVLKTQHVKPGKGGAFNQVELKSLLKGTKLNERFRSSETVEKAEVDEKKFNFLYIDGENCHFMENETFEQVEIPKSITGEQYKLLKENLEVTISFMEEKPISIDLPNNIASGLSEALKVTNFIKEKVSQIYFSDKDVVRHPLVQKIVNSYERLEKSIENPR